MLYRLVYMLMQQVNTLSVMETMGERITMLREARGISVPELAETIGVTRALVWQWEKDLVKGIRPENFIRLCHALGVTPEYLVWGPDRTPQDTSATGRLPRLRAR
jgi:transcriptional regulator with XRE-family HTH domain